VEGRGSCPGRTTAANVEQIREEVILATHAMEKRASAASFAGKNGAIHATLRALDQRAKIVGIYRERGKPDWDGVKQPVQRESRPRPRSTWREPKERLEPYGWEDDAGGFGLDDRNSFVVAKARDY
jgi:hypothetical protein